MLKEAAACSRRPTKPDSLKYFPAQIPSSSGDKTSSDTADSSNTLVEIFCRKNTDLVISTMVGLILKALVLRPTTPFCYTYVFFFYFVKNDSPHTDLKCDTSNWQVAAIFQHVEVFCHQCCTVDQTVGSFSMVSSLTVFSCHVLEPRQTQVRGVLVALCNPEKKER